MHVIEAGAAADHGRGITLCMTEDGNPYEDTTPERVNDILKIDFGLNRVFSTFEEPQRLTGLVSATTTTYTPMSYGYLTPAATSNTTHLMQQLWKLQVYPYHKAATAEKQNRDEQPASFRA